jgi:predicted dehydrogenase
MTGIVIAGVAHAHVDYVLQEVSARDDLQLLGVFDADAAAAAEVAASAGVPVFDDLDALLDLGAEIVACAAVYSERAAIVLAALHRGADVLSDKPLCIDDAELDEISAAVQETGGAVSLMLDKRTSPEMRALDASVARGELGAPVALASWAPHKLLRGDRAAWFLDPATYGDILADLLVHDIDIALQVTGARSGTVRGWFGPAIDTGFHLSGGAVVTLDGAEPCVLTAEVDWLTPSGSDIHGDYRMRVVGTDGTAELYWGRGRLELTTATASRHDAPLGAAPRSAEVSLGALLAGGDEAATATEESLLVSRIALLASRSARSGGEPRRWAAAP